MVVNETLHGFIETTQDALLVFEGCRRGLLPRTNRRLQEKERRMVQSGSIFVFDERESGIKRWTDGRMWSPSRILGNFLIYREMNKRLHGSSSDGRRCSSSSVSSASQAGDMRQRSYSADHTGGAVSTADRGRERQLVGSLSDVHKFRKDGLIKKTMSIVVNGVAQHLISYYHPRDVLHGELPSPTSMPHLASLEISSDLVRQNFRVALSVDGTDLAASASALLNYPLTPPDLENQQRLHHQFRSMSVGSLYGYGEPSSPLYSAATPTTAAADQKFPGMPLYPVQPQPQPQPQPGTVRFVGSPFSSASTPLLASSARHSFTGTGSIMPSVSYSPTMVMSHHQHGVLTQNGGGGMPGRVPPAYHGASVVHPLHSDQHLMPSFTTAASCADTTAYDNFRSSQQIATSDPSCIKFEPIDPSSGHSGNGSTTSTALAGTNLFGFPTNATGGTQHQHQHQQYEQGTTTIPLPPPHQLSKNFFYSSTC